MRYKLQLPGRPDATFQHADECRHLVYEAGFQNVQLWITTDNGKTWEELSAHAVQAVFAGD